MSSHCALHCLLVLLGVVFAHSMPVTLKECLLSIKVPLGLMEPEIGSKPLFDSIIKHINTSCHTKENLQLMNATLNVYTRMFSSILPHQHGNKTPALLENVSGHRDSVISALSSLHRNMEALREPMGKLNHNIDHILSNLNKIKVDDPVNQRRALAQFELVYEMASKMFCPN